MGNIQTNINTLIHKKQKEEPSSKEPEIKYKSILVFLDLKRDNKEDPAKVNLAKDLFGY